MAYDSNGKHYIPGECFECRGGEHEDYDDNVKLCLVQCDGERTRKVKLCGEHRMMFENDGYTITDLSPKSVATLRQLTRADLNTRYPVGSDEWKAQMNDIVKQHTGWTSLDQMCANNPTLMLTKNSTENEKVWVPLLREAYKHITGKEAYPGSLSPVRE